MKHLDLLKYGIKEVAEVIYNPSYETLYKEETNPNLTGFDRGQLRQIFRNGRRIQRYRLVDIARIS